MEKNKQGAEDRERMWDIGGLAKGKADESSDKTKSGLPLALRPALAECRNYAILSP